MTARTPPLPALRAFAALVRLGSIGAAAEELSLTQGAVGHQIRALEGFLDIQLVERSGRRLSLTEEGRAYGYQVRQALADIADATERLKRRQRPRETQLLRVSVLPSFAHGWLLARLAGFCRLHPHVRLTFHGSMAYVDLNEGKVDCAIRFGHGQWPDVVTRPLMNDRLCDAPMSTWRSRTLPISWKPRDRDWGWP
jgi:LysR family glycine cleavage system transcriptional activator